MSDVSWDADDFEPPAVNVARQTDKWEGEDEDDEIKDNWDDEEDDKEKDKEAPPDTGTLTAKKKKKKLAEIIAEKEAKQAEAIERKKKEVEDVANAMTPDQRLAEKLRLQKVQEDADLQVAKELMGTGSSSVTEEENKLLDEINLSTVEGITSFRKALVAKIRSTDRLEKKPYFVTFVEDLSRDLCQNLEQEEVKRVSAVLNSLYNEKVRANKPKSKKKGGGKAKLNVGQGAIADDISNDFGGYNEYDDFI